MIASWTSAKKSDRVFATSPYPDFCPSNSFIVLGMDKNDPYIHESTNAHKPNVKKKHVHLANIIGQTSLLKALNVHVTKAKFDFIFTM